MECFAQQRDQWNDASVFATSFSTVHLRIYLIDIIDFAVGTRLVAAFNAFYWSMREIIALTDARRPMRHVSNRLLGNYLSFALHSNR